ncbi:hypothetical protein DFH07DRAFT_1059011 [Mycena maculata]|uniref:Uncharacterized protein n=1 Tax=Mycena maculata TaxID=230809 RepID=A0AAD7JL45_9AGAR|nr:hypothetical protein DFH07DRAFT_1059011 [Mycena maculata]
MSYQMYITDLPIVSKQGARPHNRRPTGLHYFAFDNLEAKWMEAGVDVRHEHILDGMTAVCDKARNLYEARAYTPELRLSRLRLDGKVLSNLLKSVMLEDASFVPSAPKYA